MQLKIGEVTTAELLKAIGQRSPAPGGGAVAAVTLGLAASLAAMVVNYSRGRKKLSEHEPLFADALATLERISSEAPSLADADSEAYRRLNALQRLDADDPQRQVDWPAAVNGSIAAPKAILDEAMRVLDVCEHLCGRSNEWLKSDLAISGVLAEAAATSAAWNVRINLPLVSEAERREQLEDEITAALDRADAARERIEAACR